MNIRGFYINLDRRRDNQNAPLPLGPFLRKSQFGFNGFAQPNLVSQNRPFGQWGVKSKKGRLNLMGIEIDLGVHKRPDQLFNAVRLTSLG
jgi:hypothetical protein